jgi:hypothetical protein
VTMIQEAQDAFATLSLAGTTRVILLFSHPIVRQDISHDGLPIVSSAPFTQAVHDQLNNRWDFTTVAEHVRSGHPYQLIHDGDVLNCVTKAMKLTCGKLIQQTDWSDWQESNLQLNQYNSQGMFGDPVETNEGDAIFHLVWTYNIKAVDGRKKACCVCDGSTCSGKVLVLAETYANCVKQTSSCLFYALPPQKTYSFLVPTSPTRLQKPHHLNSHSLSNPTGPFTNGGSTILNIQMVT